MYDSFTIVVTLKKDDDAKVGAKSWQAYMVALSVDFLFIMVPFVLFLTVSVLLL